MTSPDYYHTLEIHQTATQADIKKSYRRLVKQFHPDNNPASTSHDRITQINAAYEVLGNPQRRSFYDQKLYEGQLYESPDLSARSQRTAQAQRQYQKHRQTGQKADEQLKQWLSQVYNPVNRNLNRILNSLQSEIDDLAADPFDDELMEGFQSYLEDCQFFLNQAQSSFRSMPNPVAVAGVAAHLYHCLNQVGDGIDELTLFTHNYDDHYLHTGQELFRIASGLRREAQSAIKNLT